LETNNTRDDNATSSYSHSRNNAVDRVETKRDTYRPKPSEEQNNPRKSLLPRKGLKRIHKVEKKYKQRRIDNDRIRNEIKQSLRDARADIQRGIDERYEKLSIQLDRISEKVKWRDKRAEKYHHQAERDITEVREHIKRVQNKYKRGADAKLEKQSQGTNAKLEWLKGREYRVKEQSQELDAEVRSIGEQRHGLSGTVERVINRIGEQIEKLREMVRKIVPKKAPSPYRGPMM
jgi:hypothetical protein